MLAKSVVAHPCGRLHTMRTGVLATLILSLLSGCINLNQKGGGSHPARPVAPVEPPAAYVPPDPNWPHGLVVGGAVTLGASWFVSTLIVPAGPSRDEPCPSDRGELPGVSCNHHTYSGWLLVPVAGPVLAFMDNAGKHDTLRGEIPYYATTMAINAAALGLVFVGVVNDGPSAPFGRSPRSTRVWTVVPLTSPSTAGAAVSGSF
jgi:hypothetical protein